MRIPWKTWRGYLDNLRKVNEAAAEQVLQYMRTHEVYEEDQVDDLIRYCYGLATKYGEAAAELAAQMYDALADLTGASVAPAIPAATATMQETAKAVIGTLKTGNDEIVSASVGRLVKMAGVDTTMQNAIRDGAEWAWIPAGDTCPFCLTLASRGWQKASKKALRGGHAEHIHANCDCTYAIRFDDSKVGGYDPEQYARIYYGADPSGTSRARINAMRREFYAENKEKINEQKRAAYVASRIRDANLPEVNLEEFGVQFVKGSRPQYPPDHIMAGKGSKTGRKIDDIARLVREYGADAENWSKRKARYDVEDEYGQIHQIEVHWYQHPQIGICEDKIKFDESGSPFADEWD